MVQTQEADLQLKCVEFKLVIIGSQGVGKTCITTRYCSKSFSSNSPSTIGSSYFTNKIYINEVPIKLHIWDTAGQEKFRSMTPIYYRNTNAALIVFDLTCESSFRDCALWVKDLQKHVTYECVICLVGNKCDMKAQRKISLHSATALADQIHAKYFECSALTNEGVNELFKHVATRLVELNQSTCLFNIDRVIEMDLRRRAQESENIKSAKGKCC